MKLLLESFLFGNDEFIFVVYRCATQWDDFNNYSGAATKPDDLQFRTMSEILYKGRDYDASVKDANEPDHDLEYHDKKCEEANNEDE